MKKRRRDKHSSTNSILLVSYYAPSRGHAGGLRLLDLYRKMRQLRPDLYLALVTVAHEIADWAGEGVEEIFDEVHRVSEGGLDEETFRRTGISRTCFDFIDLQFHQCGALARHCKKIWPEALVAFSPMDSMVRGFFQRTLLPKCGIKKRVIEKSVKLWLTFQEIRYARAADRVITVSKSDWNALKWIKDPKALFCVPTGLSEIEFGAITQSFSLGDDMVVAFFAYFGSRTNRDSLTWYCRAVHPKVKKRLPSYVLRVIGRGLDKELMDSCVSEGIEFIGQVEVISAALEGASIAIAPALDGAGVRGKVHQYSAMGIPCIATSIACEGLDYQDGESIVIADSPTAFADACTNLLSDSEMRDRIGKNARELCLMEYAWCAIEEQIRHAYEI